MATRTPIFIYCLGDIKDMSLCSILDKHTISSRHSYWLGDDTESIRPGSQVCGFRPAPQQGGLEVKHTMSGGQRNLEVSAGASGTCKTP